jgi:hypothetical protein
MLGQEHAVDAVPGRVRIRALKALPAREPPPELPQLPPYPAAAVETRHPRGSEPVRLGCLGQGISRHGGQNGK